MFNLPARAAAVLILFHLPLAAWAAGGPATDSYDGISDERWLGLHALADIYVIHNFNQPPSHLNHLREFDANSGRPSIGFARLTLAHKPDPARLSAGFRIDAGFGDIPDAFLQDDPAAATNRALSRGLSFVEQAFVTLDIPIGRGLALEAGKFGTPIGLEDNEAQMNWNYSRSLGYNWAEPSIHTGLRATYEPSESTAVSVYWLNGWNTNILAGTGMRSYAVAGRWRPIDSLELALVYAGGLERAPTHLSDPTLSFRNLLSFYMLYRPHARFQFAVSADYGNDRTQGGVQWGALAGYLRCRVFDWLAVAGRSEYYADPNGATTAARQRLYSETLTLETRLPRAGGDFSFVTRAEYRHDHSTAAVFDSSSPRTTQDTITLGVLFWF